MNAKEAAKNVQHLGLGHSERIIRQAIDEATEPLKNTIERLNKAVRILTSDGTRRLPYGWE